METVGKERGSEGDGTSHASESTIKLFAEDCVALGPAARGPCDTLTVGNVSRISNAYSSQLAEKTTETSDEGRREEEKEAR